MRRGKTRGHWEGLFPSSSSSIQTLEDAQPRKMLRAPGPQPEGGYRIKKNFVGFFAFLLEEERNPHWKRKKNYKWQRKEATEGIFPKNKEQKSTSIIATSLGVIALRQFVGIRRGKRSRINITTREETSLRGGGGGMVGLHIHLGTKRAAECKECKKLLL